MSDEQVNSAPDVCHQRAIRDERFAKEGDALQGHRLKDCSVSLISRPEAEEVIMRYEWLKSMPQIGYAYCGLFTPDRRLIGVACFGAGPSPTAGHFCGEENARRVVCLERGACAPIARRQGFPKKDADNAASFMIARACKLVNAVYGWGAFYAYADVEAREIGTVYQASNWTYLGQGAKHGDTRKLYFSPTGERFTTRRLRAQYRREGYTKTLKEYFPEVLEPAGWTRIDHREKHKYVFVMDDDMEIKEYVPREYPKRDDGSVGAQIVDWRTHKWPAYLKEKSAESENNVLTT